MAQGGGLKNLKRELYTAKATNVKIPPNLPLKREECFITKPLLVLASPFEKGEPYMAQGGGLKKSKKMSYVCHKKAN